MNQITQFKMGYRNNQRILNRRISNGPESLKEMLNVFAILFFFFFTDEFENCSFHVFEEFCGDFDGDCI
jgi:hypothetical protein